MQQILCFSYLLVCSQIVEFQNAVSHRDDLIQQLTESLQQSLVHREELQKQGERFAAEIIELQSKLVETTEVIKEHKCAATYEVTDNSESEKNTQLTSLSEVPSDLREFLENYIKKKLEEVEVIYQRQIDDYKVENLLAVKLFLWIRFSFRVKWN